MISVIIPCYNYGHLLEDTLNSLLQQTYGDWEALIIDSCSTDNTPAIAKEFIKKDKRFVYLYNEKGGISSSRNMGLKNAKGDFIQFLDADDMLQAKKFEEDLSAFQKNPDADGVYSGALYFCHPDKNKHFTTYKLTNEPVTPYLITTTTGREELLDKILGGNIFPINTVLLKKTAQNDVGLFDETIHYNEDWLFWCVCILKGKKFCYYDAPDAKALIRVHKTSVSQNEFSMLTGGIKVCRALFAQLNLPAYKKKIRKKLFSQKYLLFKLLLEGLEPGEKTEAMIARLKEVLEKDEVEKIDKLFTANNLSGLKNYLKFNLLKQRIKLKLL